MIVVQNWVEKWCILAGIRVRIFPLNSSLSVCDMNGSFQTTVGVHRKGFFFSKSSLPVSVQEFDS